jgi:hypothetical protein
MSAPEMKLWRVETTDIGSSVYCVAAATREEAQAEVEAGRWEYWRDLGSDGRTFHEIRPLRQGESL